MMQDPNQLLSQGQVDVQDKHRMKPLWVALWATVLIAVGHACYKEILNQTSLKAILNIISDSFVVSAAIIGGIGALMWIASFGQFDTLAYAGRWAWDRFTLRDLRKNAPKRESYYDYKMKKEEKRTKHTNPLLWVGLCSLALGFLFYFLYCIA